MVPRIRWFTKSFSIEILLDGSHGSHTRNNEGLSHKSKLYSSFLDTKNAFPRVWMHHISVKRHRASLRGSFIIITGTQFQSASNPQRTECHRASRISGILFVLAINGISMVVPSPLKTIVLADDVSIIFDPITYRAMKSSCNPQ